MRTSGDPNSRDDQVGLSSDGQVVGAQPYLHEILFEVAESHSRPL
ncbi:hypothetical protein [Ferrimicrobium sp.]|uniref:Uncharacterized protein n=1 Tax=Ferrimicrobium acidiphilum TaxID=121039 RepID=A0ABV3XZJ3_9ACTN|nr:hypothetical protein [Ferrimicrobium sp.]